MKLSIYVENVPTVKMIREYLKKVGFSLFKFNERYATYRFYRIKYLDKDLGRKDSVGGELDICVPNHENYADYERRVNEILETLAILDCSDTYSVWKEIEELREGDFDE